jgi:hypothetical protein
VGRSIFTSRSFNPIQKELEHLRITGLGELDPFANQFLLFAFRQGVSQERGSVARAYLPSTVSFGEWPTARPLPNGKESWLFVPIAIHHRINRKLFHIHCPNSA